MCVLQEIIVFKNSTSKTLVLLWKNNAEITLFFFFFLNDVGQTSLCSVRATTPNQLRQLPFLPVVGLLPGF